MASSSNDEGYATVAATMISLALATIAASVVSLAAAERRSASADYRRARLELALDGLHHKAAIALSIQGSRPATASVSDTDTFAAVLAENESAKLDPTVAAELVRSAQLVVPVDQRHALLAALDGPGSAGRKRERMRTALKGTHRRCVLSLISPMGGATSTPTPSAPSGPPAPGDVWRVRLTTPEGWNDDRLVRFTGDPERPVATLDRLFYRETPETTGCANVFAPAVIDAPATP